MQNFPKPPKYRIQHHLHSLTRQEAKLFWHVFKDVLGVTSRQTIYNWAKLPYDSKYSIPSDKLTALAKLFGLNSAEDLITKTDVAVQVIPLKQRISQANTIEKAGLKKKK